MKRMFVLILALVLYCSSALADHGTVQSWIETLTPLLDDIRYIEDANEAVQRLLFEHYATADGVKVPAGEYTVGVDIPVGAYRVEFHGTYEADFASFLAINDSTNFGYTTILGFTGASEIGKIDLTDGTVVTISSGDVYFYTYTGLFH